MPVLTVIAGPNGSGKSTLTDALMKRGISFGLYLNADEIARKLASQTVRPDELSRHAQEYVRRRRLEALNAGRDHAFETVMSHVSHLEYMELAASKGFEVRLFFVATEDPVINIDRVANRVAHGGHEVPRDRVSARYFRCLENLPRAMRAAFYCEIYDNSSIVDPLKLLLSCYKQSGDPLFLDQFYPDEVWAEDSFTVPVWWLEVLLNMKAGSITPDTEAP